jgi:rod shape determining protein RodA
MAGDFLRQMPTSKYGLYRESSLLRYLHIDSILLLLLAALAVVGLTVLYSASGQDYGTVKRQMIFMLLGLGAMFTVAQISPQGLQRLAIIGYVVTILLLGAVLVFGTGAKGAQRWLDLPLLPRFQPSELAKLTIPLTIATYLEHRNLPPRFKHIFWTLVMIVLPVSMIALQPDLGTSLLIAVSGLIVLFLAGIGWRYIFGALAAAIPASILMWMFVMHEYQRQRVLTLLDPEADKWGAGWNIIQSTTAIGSGGTYGKGWLEGTQSQLDFLPEGHTDFIIAVYAEEFGFMGVMALLGLYLLIIARGLWISMRAQDTFGRLLGGSITVTFFFYVFVNMGMVSGILPVVGVPLPLISQGGTSIVTLMAGFGILMAISTEKKRLSH